jgi:phosphate transport system substrate-binding protein
MARRLVLLLLGLLLAGCEGITVSTPEPTTIVISGSTSMRPVLRALTDAFRRQHPDTLFDLRGGGSTLGEAQVRTGQTTLAASVLLSPRDPVTNAPVNDGLRRVPLGLDGLAIVVHPMNDVEALSLVQLRDLYAGNVLDWMQLGGDEGEVLLVSREEGSGSRANFEARVMGETPVSLTAVVMPTAGDVVAYVAQNPYAIGYVSYAYVRERLDGDTANDAVVGVRVLPVEGVLPTLDAIKEQRYQLVEPLYLISLPSPQGRLRQFLDYTVSPAGQAIVGRYHAPVR